MARGLIAAQQRCCGGSREAVPTVDVILSAGGDVAGLAARPAILIANPTVRDVAAGLAQ